MSISRVMIRARGAGRPLTPADPLQRAVLPAVTAGAEDAADVHERRVDEWQSRLAADHELVELLAWEGYDGPQSDRLYEALAEYGWSVMRAWIATGQVFARCRGHGLRGLEEYPLAVTNEADVEDLASATVGEAIVGFRDDVLRRGRWSPLGGASLKTFFVGQCLIRFVPLYRTWSRKVREEASAVAETVTTLRAVGEVDTDELVVLRSEVVRAAVGMADPVLREIVVLNDAGFSHGEVAARVGLSSAKAVERRLHKHRHGRDGGDDAQP